MVDESAIDPANGHSSYLILHEGHPWGERDVTVPVSEIDETDTVRLE